MPADQKLPYRYKSIKSGKELKVYYTKSCRECKLKPRCTRMQRSRRIYRWIYEEIVEKMRHKMLKDKSKYNQRKALVEHPFGL